jgi:anti-sigma regulatory factor (Ser/Thr protein kinase)
VNAGGRVLATRRLRLLGEPRDVSLARAFLRRLLSDHDVAGGADAVTVLSELVTNAIVHGRGPIVVTATLHAADVELEVTDAVHSLPVQREQQVDAEDGRGVLIVGSLSAEWSASEHPDGKTVTARVPL